MSRNGAGDEEDDEPNEDGVAKPRKAAKVGSKATSARLGLTNTIEKNPKNLNAIKVDGENVTDPMFQKMSKAFDEGGAKGMLMNNLKMAPHSCSLIFSENEDAAGETPESVPNAAPVSVPEQKSMGLSVSGLSDLINRLNITPVSLANCQICPLLNEYRSTVGLDGPSSGAALALAVAAPVVSQLPVSTSSSGSAAGNEMDSASCDYDTADYVGRWKQVVSVVWRQCHSHRPIHRCGCT